jgi:hypothetical protein
MVVDTLARQRTAGERHGDQGCPKKPLAAGWKTLALDREMWGRKTEEDTARCGGGGDGGSLGI